MPLPSSQEAQEIVSFLNSFIGAASEKPLTITEFLILLARLQGKVPELPQLPTGGRSLEAEDIETIEQALFPKLSALLNLHVTSENCGTVLRDFWIEMPPEERLNVIPQRGSPPTALPPSAPQWPPSEENSSSVPELPPNAAKQDPPRLVGPSARGSAPYFETPSEPHPLQQRLYQQPLEREAVQLAAQPTAAPRMSAFTDPTRGVEIRKINPNGRNQVRTVDCSVFGPKHIALNDMFLVQVFVHFSEDFEQVVQQAQQIDDEAAPRTTKTLSLPVMKWDDLTFQLTIPGLSVDTPVQTLNWREEAASVDFGVTVPKTLPHKTLIGTVIVSLERVPIGTLKFKLSVSQQPDPEPVPISDTAQAFRHAFVSYCSKDRQEVLKRVQILVRLGIEVFQDVLSLEPGDRWEQRLYEKIAAADLFLLFWSAAAKNSEWVLKEARYALQCQGIHPDQLPTIIPIVIEGPEPILPPPELRNLHFQDVFTYLIAGSG
ncbi:hypothetical protein C7271_10810 [filamentous cyanobacterium CCP5]|nr:hypothetical protein C7271_10810 [filamentous cyanobacterium CCP5]